MQPRPQFVEQTRLAQARVGHHRDTEQTAAARGHVGKGPLQQRQLGLPAEQWHTHPLHTTAVGTDGRVDHVLHQVGLQGFVAALDPQRRLLGHHKQATHQAPGVLADAQGARWRGLLHARRHVDGVAADGVYTVHTATQQHPAAADAHPHAQFQFGVAHFQLLRLRLPLTQQCQAGQHRALGVVFTHLVGAKHRQHAVTGILQDPPTVLFNHPGEGRQGAVKHRLDVLGIELAAQRRGAHDVQEQHRHQAQVLLGLRRLIGLQRGQLAAQGGHRRFNHLVTQQ